MVIGLYDILVADSKGKITRGIRFESNRAWSSGTLNLTAFADGQHGFAPSVRQVMGVFVRKQRRRYQWRWAG